MAFSCNQQWKYGIDRIRDYHTRRFSLGNFHHVRLVKNVQVAAHKQPIFRLSPFFHSTTLSVMCEFWRSSHWVQRISGDTAVAGSGDAGRRLWHHHCNSELCCNNWLAAIVWLCRPDDRLAAQPIPHAGVHEVIWNLPHAVRKSGWYISAVGWS